MSVNTDSTTAAGDGNASATDTAVAASQSHSQSEPQPIMTTTAATISSTSTTPTNELTVEKLQSIKQEWEHWVAATPTPVPSTLDSSLSFLLSHRALMTTELLRVSSIGKSLVRLVKKLSQGESQGMDAATQLKRANEVLASWKATAAAAAAAATGSAATPSTPSASPSASPTPSSSPPVPGSTSTSSPVARTPSDSGLTSDAASRKRKIDEAVNASAVAATSASTASSSSSSSSSSPSSASAIEPAGKRVHIAPPPSAAPTNGTSAKAASASYPLPSVKPPQPAAARNVPLPGADAFFSSSARSSSSPAPSASPSSSSSSSSSSVIGDRTPLLSDGLRGKIRLQLCRSLADESDLKRTVYPNDLCTLAEEIEANLFDKCKGDTGGPYKNKAREVAMNLKDRNNPELKERVMNGDISVHDLLTLPFTELASSALKKQREEAMKWEMAERRSDIQANQTITDAFRCGKCKERQCTYYQMQTRSADEPMTTFVRCTKCGNRWKC